MLIAIDYDDCYTRDPALWNTFIDNAKAKGHTVVCCTARKEEHRSEVEIALGDRVEIYCTAHKAKRYYMYKQGINVDVCIASDDAIDDEPVFILNDGK